MKIKKLYGKIVKCLLWDETIPPLRDIKRKANYGIFNEASSILVNSNCKNVQNIFFFMDEYAPKRKCKAANVAFLYVFPKVCYFEF